MTDAKKNTLLVTDEILDSSSDCRCEKYDSDDEGYYDRVCGAIGDSEDVLGMWFPYVTTSSEDRPEDIIDLTDLTSSDNEDHIWGQQWDYDGDYVMVEDDDDSSTSDTLELDLSEFNSVSDLTKSCVFPVAPSTPPTPAMPQRARAKRPRQEEKKDPNPVKKHRHL